MVYSSSPCKFYYFMIVLGDDSLVYEAEFTFKPRSQFLSQPDNYKHHIQYLCHSALDCIDEYKYKTDQLYLKQIDKYGEFMISAYLCYSGVRLIILHDTSNVDGIRHFFNESYLLLTKYLLNPLKNVTKGERIDSPEFDRQVTIYANKHLRY